MQSNVSLKVAEAPQSDVGLGRARVDAKTMEALGLTEGKIVEIAGKRSTVARLFNLSKEDEGKGIVRLDGLMRKNLRVALLDTVEVRRAEVLAAKRATFAPIIGGGHKISFGEGIETFVKRGLLHRPLKRGDAIIIPGIALMGGALPFLAVNVTPEGIVEITDESILEILEEPVTERSLWETPDEPYDYLTGELSAALRRWLASFDSDFSKLDENKREKAKRLAESARKLADEAESEN